MPWNPFWHYIDAVGRKEKPYEKNVLGINCHERNLETFATFSSHDNSCDF